jgi:adenosylcobinamide kinase / adenosylcobinamide-phosphate guanylyltransferase
MRSARSRVKRDPGSPCLTLGPRVSQRHAARAVVPARVSARQVDAAVWKSPHAARAHEALAVSARIMLVGGGVRCGKSAFALGLARPLGPRRAFIATAQPFDDEMRVRIAAHRSERRDEFETIEEPLALPERLLQLQADVVVVDCLTLWLSNLLLRDASDLEIDAQVAELARVLALRRYHSVLVTNEVGMGLVPESALGRRFRDASGRAHQRLAALSDEIYFGVLGGLLRLRPEPVTLMFPENPHDPQR